ncbi:hypothetical protein NL676_008933 [Syzygium grande]|nr:hypothetical protein NL676_008933 [Syzygium grande]
MLTITVTTGRVTGATSRSTTATGGVAGATSMSTTASIVFISWSASSRVFTKSGSFGLYLVWQSLWLAPSRVMVVAAASVEPSHSLYFPVKLAVSVGIVQAKCGVKREVGRVGV